MSGFFSKVARFAVSKMAAFCYAVAVGVAGNLIFHYVQTHETVPSVAATHRETPSPVDKPAAAAPAAAIVANPSPPPVVQPRPVALPEPAAVNLPLPTAMSAPPLKPTALPSSPAPVEPAVQPAAAFGSAPSSTAAPSPAAALPPLGPAIEVAVPPASPAAAIASAPISLLPETRSPLPEIADKPPGSAKPGGPGPGSGGLY